MANEIIYPGTFDPITNGHIDLIERAGRIFTKVIVAVSVVSSKSPIFSAEEREKIAKEVLKNYKNVEVCRFSGLLINFSESKNVYIILRGLRAVTDFEYELQLANINRTLNSKVETVFLAPSEKYTYISSSVVREIASNRGKVSSLVPNAVEEALRVKFGYN